MKNTLNILVLLVCFCFLSAQVKMHNSLRVHTSPQQSWIEIPHIKIPDNLKAEAYRRAFDSSYEHYDPINWFKHI